MQERYLYRANTENYVKTCEFEVVGNVFDNHKLLEV